jgi:endonuclease/exonuclease/phosphatase family metal-dependent hydrolase
MSRSAAGFTVLLISSSLFLAALASPRSPVPQEDAGHLGSDPLVTMSFNIRYGTARDGDDAWPLRREQAIDVVRDFAPAVLGLQEALRFQIDEILEALPHYGEVGVGRDDGVDAGEHSSILYDPRRLELLDGGTFWLSDTPEVPGSMSWGNRVTRIAVWAHLHDRATDRGFRVFNTHWDHESQPARERSARLILERIAQAAGPDDPVILMGDFNAGERNPAFRALLDGFVDTYRAIHPPAEGEQVGTFHAFTGEPAGEKIDAILVSPHWRTLDARIVRSHRNGRYPSDHFPVTATLERAGNR